MFYYSFNIGDYITGSYYFTDDQDLAYRRLLDLYYSTESPIDDETQSVSNRIRMAGKEDAVSFVLHEKFTIGDDGKWHNDVCDENILKYRETCKKNKINGLAGGRPKKNPVGYQSQPNRNPNQEPITNNIYNHLTVTKSAREDGFKKNGFLEGMDGWFEPDEHAMNEIISNCRGWNIQFLVKKYHEHVKSEGEKPKYPQRAFVGWAKKFTKGKPPS